MKLECRKDFIVGNIFLKFKQEEAEAGRTEAYNLKFHHRCVFITFPLFISFRGLWPNQEISNLELNSHSK